MKYKIWLPNGVRYTSDKILADFMNKNLTLWQRIQLWFRK